MALLGILVYVYYHVNGQFEDHEEAKYQLFREEEQIERENYDKT